MVASKEHLIVSSGEIHSRGGRREMVDGQIGDLFFARINLLLHQPSLARITSFLLAQNVEQKAQVV